MTKYIVKLTDQENMTLRQLASQPGFEVIFKLLQCESLDAQTAAMECKDTDVARRLTVLTDAQATVRVVSSLIHKLAAYQQVPEMTQEEEDDPFSFLSYERNAN